jgi:hypothetical protein
MEYKEWLEKYKPINNPFSSVPDIVIGDTEQEKDFIKTQNPKCVWTMCSADDWEEIMSGYHFVNSDGIYYITEIPCEGEDFVNLNED